MGVYVHFPWCLQKCPYCDFLSMPLARDQIPHVAYADAVLAELDGRLKGDAPELVSVFFGGGTPSLWRPSELGRVLKAVLSHFRTLATEAEITVECNPSSFDRDIALALLDIGVNRVSIGVQSLDAGRLAFLGRLHDSGGALAAIETAMRAGFARVSADLIFGVAGQEPEAAAREARTVAELGLSHVSAYALTIEPGTRFGALARKGRLPLLAETAVADSFVSVHEALTSLGFDHYEISNFARGGDVARHNVGYWRGDDYLGVGVGAWGTITEEGRRIRYRNTPVVDRYLAGAETWTSAELDRAGLISELEPIDAPTALAERMMLGLRLAEGVDVESVAAELGAAPWPASRTRAVDRLVARGRLVRDGPRLRIPVEQWLFADGTIAELM